MLKPKLYLIFILSFAVIQVNAQNIERLYGALAIESSHPPVYDSSMVETYVQRDSLMINDIKSATELGLFIKRGLQNKIYAIEINNYLRPDLTAIVKLLAQCPNLQYLKIIDRYGSGISSEYKLPDEVTQLQQLKGFEFSFIDKLDMNDALFKVSTLKNLQMLVFTDYRQALPPILNAIAHVTTVRLSTTNIKGIDLSNTNWQTAYVREAPLDPENNERALLGMSKIKSLRKLNLELTKLRDTAVIGKFTQLRSLQVSGWKFNSTALVNKIGTLVQLKSLLLELPLDSTCAFDGLRPLHNLTSLAVYAPLHTRERVFNIMNVIADFKNLESLSLSGYFNTLPDVFDKLPKLKALSLRYNALTTLPIGIFKLPNLEYLDVSLNNLSELPNADKYESNSLKNINLKDNALTSLPPAITRLTVLENLNVSDNKLSSLPVGWDNLPRLKSIDFSSNELTAYPPGLQNNHSVEHISLFLNKISYIPDVTSNNYRLRELSLNSNQLTSLPEHIGRYNNLLTFDVSNNKFTSLPTSLSDCKKLQQLKLSNSLTETAILPLGLKDVFDLTLLDLSENPKLNTSNIFDVMLFTPRKNLHVDLRDCGIDKLPATNKWATIPFSSLNLSGNKLKTLPLEFANVKVAQGAELMDNPFPGNPRAYYTPVKTKADMQAVFKEIDTRLPDVTAPKADRVIALLKFSHYAFYQADYITALQYANQTMAIDIDLYNKNAQFDEIGICRFNLKDYNGAIKDFDLFISRTTKGSYTTNGSEVWRDKIQAHLILNQPDEAAKASVYFFGGIDNCQYALTLCKKSGNKILYQQLLDSTLTSFKQQFDRTNSLGMRNGAGFILNYACLFIMANKPTDAVKIMQQDMTDPFPKDNTACKDLLTAFAKYLIDPAAFDTIKQSLQSDIDFGKKIALSMYRTNLANFSDWLPYSDFTSEQQQHLRELQKITM